MFQLVPDHPEPTPVTIYTLGPHRAEISPDAYVHPAATIIGQVIIGPGPSCASTSGTADRIRTAI